MVVFRFDSAVNDNRQGFKCRLAFTLAARVVVCWRSLSVCLRVCVCVFVCVSDVCGCAFLWKTDHDLPVRTARSGGPCRPRRWSLSGPALSSSLYRCCKTAAFPQARHQCLGCSSVPPPPGPLTPVREGR